MEEAATRLQVILAHATKLNLPERRVILLKATKKLLPSKGCGQDRHFLLVPAVVLAFLFYVFGLYTQDGFSRTWITWNRHSIHDRKCTINMPDSMIKAFRPPVACAVCQDISRVARVAAITPAEFEDKYAYSGIPVVVTDAMHDWTAQHVFSFDFFRGLYEQSGFYGNCQFFPYETEFLSLKQVFNMSKERADMRHGAKPWYIGWSNCEDRVGRELREHYSRPYFLPDTAETKKVDWIFMGSPGHGAKMHVDNVNHPSWQAQLRGSKRWTLQPPPECFYACRRLQVLVRPGEIFVLDTNLWYHETEIMPGDMSITIGAEYD